MITTVQRIEAVGPGARARRISFGDGLPDRVTSAAALRQLGLEVGTTVDHDVVLGELAESEPSLARERALQLLGYRERSARELTDRLRSDGYPDSIAVAVVERFREVDLVDDARFAAAWVRSRVTAGYGLRRIERELALKGVSESVIQEALEESVGEDEVSRARQVLRGRVAQDRRERDKLIRRLVTRGFDMRVAVEAVCGPGEDPSDKD